MQYEVPECVEDQAVEPEVIVQGVPVQIEVTAPPVAQSDVSSAATRVMPPGRICFLLYRRV